jgi:hypothetical protein
MKKDPLDKTADVLKGTVDDVRDMLHEASHRATADAERTHREIDDDMTPEERAKSMANEAKNRVQANMDAAKRQIRND